MEAFNPTEANWEDIRASTKAAIAKEPRGYPKRLSEEESSAVKEYTDELTCYYTNAYLRTGNMGPVWKEDMDRMLKDTDSALRRGSLKEPIAVYRVVGPDFRLTKKFEDKSYVSTTYDVGAARRFNDYAHEGAGKILRIVVPPGTPLGFIENVSKSKHEKEVLLGRGYTYELAKTKDGKAVFVARRPD